MVEDFVDGARRSLGPSLHVDGDVLFLSGWWHAAVRLADDAFIVRAESPREDSPVLELVTAALTGRGLSMVAESHPLVQPITYAELSLAGVEWSVWARDPGSGERALAARVGAESDPREVLPGELPELGDLSLELEGARRVAGLPPALVLVVGLDPDRLPELQAALPECRVEARELGSIAPDACGDLRPAIVLVDATNQRGREFIMELRAAACGRFLPVVGITPAGEAPLGADVGLPAARSPGTWRSDLVRLLP